MIFFNDNIAVFGRDDTQFNLPRPRNSGAYAKQSGDGEAFPERAKTFERRVKSLITHVMRVGTSAWPLVSLTIVPIMQTIVASFTRAPPTNASLL